MSGRSAPFCALALFAAPLLLGCSETTVEVELHSLQASGEAAFVCRTSEGRGIDRSQCPDFEDLGHRIFALVTQTSTEEVAIIDTHAAEVVDVDPSVPGYSFLRVPSRPGDIASTPGGAATFVGITGVGKTGITAIPTTCIGAPRQHDPPQADETTRDVTSFASCHLPSAPGDITVLVAPPEADDTIRESCDAGSGPENPAPPGEIDTQGGERRECGANLTLEHLDAEGNTVGPRGRRKLAVALPFEVIPQIVIIDAQWLLDQKPGSFEECRIDATLALDVDLGPAGTKQLFDDAPELEPPDGCVIEQPVTPPTPPSYTPRPAGFALADDRLYVADQEAPVVHVLDVSNPCAPSELPPLLPMSYERPNRVVTTSRVAASPLTPSGKRYVYAIDEFDQPASSIMAFDVSQGSVNRTPLLRPGSLRIPEPPDRLLLSSDVADIAFALRDLPAADPVTGIAETGVHCDPDPSHVGTPATQHRPTSDKTRGAQPRLLRGLFGLAMLTSGHIAIIDVDDFDAPCRRPIQTNPNPLGVEDFRGCSGDDPEWPAFLTLSGNQDGAPTVTNEVSCNIVRPHRFRSAGLGVTSATLGAGAPSLISFPVFSRPTDVNLPPQHQPKLLAVPFEPVGDQEPPLAEAYIGTTLHQKGRVDADLPTDPNTTLLSSLTLPFFEPRSLPTGEAVSVVYEAAITDGFPSGSIILEDSELRIVDPSAEYCSKGVYDHEMFVDYASSVLRVDDPDLFASTHADLVEITSDLLPVTDSYWVSCRMLGTFGDPENPADECPADEADFCQLTRNDCFETFGDYDPEEVNPNRELAVIEAYQDRLVVEPRSADDREELQKRFECCFPQGIEHRVRVQKQWVIAGSRSRFKHDVATRREPIIDVNGEEVGTLFGCVRSCDPRLAYAQSRVFEIASSVPCAGTPGTCAVGLAEPGDPCVYNASRADGSIDLANPDDAAAAACIHSGLTARFALYRGVSPSVRGMRFSWETTGGFRALVSSIASVSPAVLPQHVQYVPELQRIAVVDGAALGLSLISLDSLRVERPWPVY
jgi:hypothetical protein